ncbi:MAG: LamG-like jellyroll fold domain-containing protein [Verrucomicrobiota bacterium]
MAASLYSRDTLDKGGALVNRNHLEELCQAALDGTATDGDAVELQNVLRHNANARALYWEYVRLHQALELRFSHASALPARSSVMEFPGTRRGTATRATLAAAAAIAIGIGTWAVLARDRSAATYRASTQSILRIEHANGAKHAAGTLMPGSRIHLRQGQIELHFSGGTRSVIQGPAELRLQSSAAIELRRGNGWFHVSRKDHGFQVTTPELNLIDYGTDFGVRVNLLDPDEIHVFSGEVKATPRSGGQGKHLVTGMARLVDSSGTLAEIPLAPDSFARTMSQGLPYLRVSFDALTDGRFSVTGTHPEANTVNARLNAGKGSPTLVAGVSGNALRMSGRGDQVVTDWPGISGIAPRTVMYWLKVDPAANLLGHPSIVGWGDYHMPRGKWKTMLLQEVSGGPAFPRISFGGYAYDAAVPVNDGKWHHLAFSYTGKAAENGHPDVAIHIDGKNQGTLKFRNYDRSPFDHQLPETNTEGAAQPMGIASVIDDSPVTFAGQIDELKIFAGVLADDDIRAEYRKGGDRP